MRTLMELSREELYELVWAEPLSLLAPRFGVSDVGLKKRCISLRVPTPGRGYWERLAAGKRPRKAKLEDFVDLRKKSQLPPKPFLAPSLDYSLTKPHLVISGLKSAQRGAVTGIPTLKQSWGAGIRVEVSDASFRRCCWLLNAVIQASEDLGVTVGADVNRQGQVLFRLKGESARVFVREKLRRVEAGRADSGDWSYPRFLYVATGRLRIGLVYSRISDKEFEDRQNAPLDSRVNEIAESIVKGLKTCASLREERRLEAIRVEEQRRIREQQRAEKEAEQTRLLGLEQLAEDLEKSRLVFNLASKVEEQILQAGWLPSDDGEAAKWLKWAREHAAKLSPVEGILNKLLKSEPE